MKTNRKYRRFGRRVRTSNHSLRYHLAKKHNERRQTTKEKRLAPLSHPQSSGQVSSSCVYRQLLLSTLQCLVPSVLLSASRWLALCLGFGQPNMTGRHIQPATATTETNKADESTGTARRHSDSVNVASTPSSPPTLSTPALVAAVAASTNQSSPCECTVMGNKDSKPSDSSVHPIPCASMASTNSSSTPSTLPSTSFDMSNVCLGESSHKDEILIHAILGGESEDRPETKPDQWYPVNLKVSEATGMDNKSQLQIFDRRSSISQQCVAISNVFIEELKWHNLNSDLLEHFLNACNREAHVAELDCMLLIGSKQRPTESWSFGQLIGQQPRSNEPLFNGLIAEFSNKSRKNEALAAFRRFIPRMGATTSSQSAVYKVTSASVHFVPTDADAPYKDPGFNQRVTVHVVTDEGSQDVDSFTANIKAKDSAGHVLRSFHESYTASIRHFMRRAVPFTGELLHQIAALDDLSRVQLWFGANLQQVDGSPVGRRYFYVGSLGGSEEAGEVESRVNETSITPYALTKLNIGHSSTDSLPSFSRGSAYPVAIDTFQAILDRFQAIVTDENRNQQKVINLYIWLTGVYGLQVVNKGTLILVYDLTRPQPAPEETTPYGQQQMTIYEFIHHTGSAIKVDVHAQIDEEDENELSLTDAPLAAQGAPPVVVTAVNAPPSILEPLLEDAPAEHLAAIIEDPAPVLPVEDAAAIPPVHLAPGFPHDSPDVSTSTTTSGIVTDGGLALALSSSFEGSVDAISFNRGSTDSNTEFSSDIASSSGHLSSESSPEESNSELISAIREEDDKQSQSATQSESTNATEDLSSCRQCSTCGTYTSCNCSPSALSSEQSAAISSLVSISSATECTPSSGSQSSGSPSALSNLIGKTFSNIKQLKRHKAKKSEKRAALSSPSEDEVDATVQPIILAGSVPNLTPMSASNATHRSSSPNLSTEKTHKRLGSNGSLFSNILSNTFGRRAHHPRTSASSSTASIASCHSETTSMSSVGFPRLFGANIPEPGGFIANQSLRLPKTIRLLLQAILKNDALKSEGIFRNCGSTCQVKHLRVLLQRLYESEQLADSDEFDKKQYHEDVDTLNSSKVFDLAASLKLYIRELPESLLSLDNLADWIEIGKQISEAEKSEQPVDTTAIIVRIREVLELDNLDVAHSARITLLRFILSLLVQIMRNEENTKMTSNNLAICTANSLLPVPMTAGSMPDRSQSEKKHRSSSSSLFSKSASTLRGFLRHSITEETAAEGGAVAKSASVEQMSSRMGQPLFPSADNLEPPRPSSTKSNRRAFRPTADVSDIRKFFNDNIKLTQEVIRFMIEQCDDIFAPIMMPGEEVTSKWIFSLMEHSEAAEEEEEEAPLSVTDSGSLALGDDDVFTGPIVNPTPTPPGVRLEEEDTAALPVAESSELATISPGQTLQMTSEKRNNKRHKRGLSIIDQSIFPMNWTNNHLYSPPPMSKAFTNESIAESESPSEPEKGAEESYSDAIQTADILAERKRYERADKLGKHLRRKPAVAIRPLTVQGMATLPRTSPSTRPSTSMATSASTSKSILPKMISNLFRSSSLKSTKEEEAKVKSPKKTGSPIAVRFPTFSASEHKQLKSMFTVGQFTPKPKDEFPSHILSQSTKQSPEMAAQNSLSKFIVTKQSKPDSESISGSNSPPSHPESYSLGRSATDSQSFSSAVTSGTSTKPSTDTSPETPKRRIMLRIQSEPFICQTEKPTLLTRSASVFANLNTVDRSTGSKMDSPSELSSSFTCPIEEQFYIKL